jgi:regulatory protein YycI of two-component signal transduction system YycFG
MQNELAETNKSYEDLTERQKTWATVAIDAVRRVANAIKDSTQTADSAVAQQQEKSNRDIGDSISELVNLFKSGKAKTNVTNTRDFRSVSYG